MNAGRIETPAPPVRRIAVGEDAFEYVDVGRGPPVLFLHGAPGDWRMWRRHCAALSARFRAISYTQRYFGIVRWRADGPPFGTATHANDLVAFAEALGAGRPAVVAWSYAGHAVLQAALTRPDLFSRMLVFEPGVASYVADPDELAAFARSAHAMFAPVLEAVQGGDNKEAVRRLVNASGGDHGYFDRQSVERRTVQFDNAHAMPRLFAQVPPPHIGSEDLGRLRLPVSIRWGALSRDVFTISSRPAARAIPTGSHAEVPGVGHLWPEEDPNGFAAMVEEWLHERI